MAYSIDTGKSYAGRISSLGEVDAYNTTFIKGLTYSVSVNGAASGGGTLADPNLGLYNLSGTRLLFNDDVAPGTNRDAQLVFTVSSTGVYQLRAGEMGNNATGTYTLDVSAGLASRFNDSVTGTSAADAINGLGGNDYLNGAGGNDQLIGGGGADSLLGAAGNDRLFGNDGNDLLRGGNGADMLMGGTGADRLMGGVGADVFVFTATNQSNSANGIDRVVSGDDAAAIQGIGVAGGDVIDLSGIDANVNRSGNQAFVWDSSRAAGTIALYEENGNTVLRGHTNGDGIADFTLIIQDGAVTAQRYITGDEFIL